MKTASPKMKGPAEKTLLEKRLNNIQSNIITSLNYLSVEEQLVLLTLPDDEFWFEAQMKARTQQFILSKTPEKTEQQEFAENRLAFMDHLQKFGGVHKSTVVEKLIHASVPTVIKYGEKNKLIVLNWGAENLYPTFQFSTDENNSEKGMLAGVPELLAAMQHKVSAVRKCNFFTNKIELPVTGERVSILTVLRRGAKPEEMQYFKVLAENFGTQNAI